MNELTEGQLKQKTKAQLMDGFILFKRKVTKETNVISMILPNPYILILFTIFSSLTGFEIRNCKPRKWK